MTEKYFSSDGTWTCPKCGTSAQGPRCSNCNFCIYAGFWARVFASLVDKGFIWSAAQVFMWTRNYSLTHFWSLTLFGFLFYRVYHIGFVALWGQTPGKMAARIKVVRLDGSPANFWNALLRNSVETSLTLLALVLEMRAMGHLTDAQFLGVEMAKRQDLINVFIPGWAVYIAWATQGFVLSEFIVLFFNKKKRAIHDFIAGTVIVHDTKLPYLPFLPEESKHKV